MNNQMLVLVLQIVAIGAVFYFLIIRPQGQARKRAEEMVAAIKKGDEVVTAGGIVGRVKDVKDSRLTIETGTATIVVERSRIVRVGDQTASGVPGA
jgi:preprotein translocase subunit YajC